MSFGNCPAAALIAVCTSCAAEAMLRPARCLRGYQRGAFRALPVDLGRSRIAPTSGDAELWCLRTSGMHVHHFQMHAMISLRACGGSSVYQLAVVNEAIRSKDATNDGSTDKGVKAMLTKPALALATSFFVIGATLGAASSNELPMRAVVDGHPVQPTESQLQAIGYPDMTTSEAKEVRNLYRQLMQGNDAKTHRSG